MSRRLPAGRGFDEEQPASLEVSRVLVLGFIIAAILGLLCGVGWVGWNLVRNAFAG
jgi:hypothetical protein